METFTLQNIVKEIIDHARTERNKTNPESRTPVNFVSVFPQTKFEYIKLLAAAHALGKLIKETPEGSIFSVPLMETSCGQLSLIKICGSVSSKGERGLADFSTPTLAEQLGLKTKAQI